MLNNRNMIQAMLKARKKIDETFAALLEERPAPKSKWQEYGDAVEQMNRSLALTDHPFPGLMLPDDDYHSARRMA
jgi:hypothetical protein